MTRTGRPWSQAVAAYLVFAWVLLTQAGAQETEPGISGRPTSGRVTLGDLLDSTGNERERRIQKLVQEALAAKEKTGTWQRLQNKKLVQLSAQQAALAALKKNLSIDISRFDADRVQQAIREAEAVFDPVFDLSFDYRRSDTEDRTVSGTVNQQLFQPGLPTADPNRTEIDLDPQVTALTGIERIIFGTLQPQQVDSTIFASREQPNGATEAFTYSVALQQQLPWGPRFDVTLATTDQEVFFDTRGNSFGAPWASDLIFNLDVPLPGAKDFGPYAAFDTDVKLAKKESERGYWVLESTVNSTLLQVQLAYLDLVQNLENLLVAIDNRQILERQSAHVERLFEKRLARNYDKAQIEADLARARAQEDFAQNAFIAASDTLATLVEYSGQAVKNNIYLPYGYSPWLDTQLSYAPEEVLTTAMRQRPELQVSRVDQDTSKILRQFSDVDARPDIDLNVSVRAQQDGRRFGYKNYLDSIGNIDSPDVLEQSYGITYRYPWGNRAFKARLAQAESGVVDSALGTQETNNLVVREVNDALTGIQTARDRAKRAEQNLKSAREAYNSLARRQELGGDVNVNELLTQVQILLGAKLTKISATIDNKRAESNLLAAQGIISQHYGGMTARNALERQRISRLAEQEGFQYLLR